MRAWISIFDYRPPQAALKFRAEDIELKCKSRVLLRFKVKFFAKFLQVVNQLHHRYQTFVNLVTLCGLSNTRIEFGNYVPESEKVSSPDLGFNIDREQ